MEEDYEYGQEGNNVPEASNNAGNVIGWLDKLGNMIAKNGIKNTMSTVLLLLLLGVVGYYIYNPSKIITKVEDIQQQAHTEMVAKRIKSDTIIRRYLVDMREELDADRTFIFEAHNGGSNINGLPFLYMDMTYDEPVMGMPKIMDEYTNVHQSRYALMDVVYRENFWYGNVEDLKDIDMELYYRLSKGGATYIGLISIYGKLGLSGGVGVEYCGETAPDRYDVKRIMYQYSNYIAPLITNQN